MDEVRHHPAQIVANGAAGQGEWPGQASTFPLDQLQLQGCPSPASSLPVDRERQARGVATSTSSGRKAIGKILAQSAHRSVSRSDEERYPKHSDDAKATFVAIKPSAHSVDGARSNDGRDHRCCRPNALEAGTSARQLSAERSIARRGAPIGLGCLLIYGDHVLRSEFQNRQRDL